jgi:hypothetical protein
MTKERGSKGPKGLRKDTVKDLDAADKAGDVKGGMNTQPARPGTAIPTPPVKPSPAGKRHTVTERPGH